MGEGNGNPLQYSCLETHGGRSLVGYSPCGREKSDMMRGFTFTSQFHALEKKMATHSSALAWRIPGTGAPSGRPSMVSHRVRHDWLSSSSSCHFQWNQWILQKDNSYTHCFIIILNITPPSMFGCVCSLNKN